MAQPNYDTELNQEFISKMLTDIQNGNNPSPAQMLQTSMNLLMMAERNLHLQQNPETKGNGFFERKLGTPMGELELKVPRDRRGDFRSAILPEPYQRDYAQREELLKSLLVGGYSPNQIQNTLTGLNLHYNPKEIETLREEYHDLFIKWQQRELPQDVIALFIDAYHADALINDKVCKLVAYAVIGIDFAGYKSLYGIYLYQGSECKAFWMQTFNQLITRGLKSPLFVISDDFTGLKDGVATLFPQALHQLCFIHMQRNVRRNRGISDAQTFNQNLAALKVAANPEQAITQFETLCQSYQPQYPAFIKALLADKQNYFAFLHLPPPVRKFFYTTNSVESFNSLLEKIRQRAGGFFQSEAFLKINVFLCVRQLQQRKWLKGMPHIKNNLYALRQLFALQYKRLPTETKVRFIDEN